MIRSLSSLRAVALLPFLLLLVFLTGAWAEEAPIVAVADFDCETGFVQGCRLAGQAAEMMTTSLFKTGDLQMVERSRLQKVLMEQKLSVSGLVDTANVSHLGKLVAADYMAIGSVSQFGENWVGHIRVVESVSGKILFADSIEAPDEGKFLSAIREKAEQIASQLRRIQKGSYVLTFQVKTKEGGKNPLSAQDIKRLLEVLAKKAKNYGASAVDVRQAGNGVVVDVSGIAEPLELAGLLMQDDSLEFHLAGNVPPPDDSGIPPGYKLYNIEERNNPQPRPILVRTKVELTGDRIESSSVSVDRMTGQPFIVINFDKEGTKKFAALTGNSIDKPLAILLNGTVLTAPIIRTTIANGSAQITGMFDMKSAFRLSVNLKSGRLPAEISLEGIEKK